MVTRQNRPEMDAERTEEELRELLEAQSLEIAALGRKVRDLEAHGIRFISAASHAVMNPLTIIQSYLEIVLSDLRGGLSTQQTQFIETAHTAAQRLHRLVECLVELAALELGAAEIELEDLAVGDVVNDVCYSHSPSADASGVDLEMSIAPQLPRVMADANRLRSAIESIVANALQWTPRGGVIRVTASFRDGVVVVAVTDTGPGIPEDNLDRVFDEFARLPRSDGEPQRGTGLSLAIAKRQIEAMGGGIDVSSTVGSGSRFALRIPALAEDR